MQNLGLVLLIFGFVCFTIAAFISPSDPQVLRMRLIAAGLAFVTAAEIFGGLGKMFHAQ